MKIQQQNQGFFKRIFSHNLREKLLATLCTVVIMLAAVCFKPLHKVYMLKINTKISPDQVLVSGVDSLEVKVAGNFFGLRKIKSEDLVINFDFSSEKAGEISRNIGDKELPAVFLPLDVKSIAPQKLVYITEERRSESAPETPASEDETVKEQAEQEPSQESVGTTPAETFQETSLPAKKETGEK